MKFALIMFLLFSVLTAGEKEKPAAKKIDADTTSMWMKRTDAIRIFTQKREELKTNYFQQDAFIQGQIEVFNAITQDSIKVKR